MLKTLKRWYGKPVLLHWDLNAGHGDKLTLNISVKTASYGKLIYVSDSVEYILIYGCSTGAAQTCKML